MGFLDFNLDDEPKTEDILESNIEINTILDTIGEAQNTDDDEQDDEQYEEKDQIENDQIIETAEADIVPEHSITERFVRPNSTQARVSQGQKKRSNGGRPATSKKETIQAKAVPRNLLDLARRDAGISSTVSNSNAIAAYIYMKASDKSGVNITDELREIIEECEGDRTAQNMNDRITAVEKEIRSISKKMDEISLALNYLVLNASGLSYENAHTASDVNLLEKGVLDIRKKVREQANELRKSENNSGRPFRKK